MKSVEKVTGMSIMNNILCKIRLDHFLCENIISIDLAASDNQTFSQRYYWKYAWERAH